MTVQVPPIDFPFTEALVVGFTLFGLGVYGFLFRRNLIILLLSLELMTNGANVVLAAFNRLWGYATTRVAFTSGAFPPSPFSLIGHVFIVLSITIAVAEAALGLALLVLLYRRYKSSQIEEFTKLRW